MTVLVLTSSNLTQSMQTVLRNYMKRADFPPFDIVMDTEITFNLLKKKGQKTIVADLEKLPEFHRRLQQLINKHHPKMIFINEKYALEFITQKHRSLALIRGSVYFINKIPAFVIDAIRTTDNVYKLKADPKASWLLKLDLKKAKRWYDGKQRKEPAFQFEIVDTLEKLREFESTALSTIIGALDVETTGKGNNAKISCTGYSFLLPKGEVKCYTIPLLNPFKEAGCQWTDEEFTIVYQTIKRVHDLPFPKILQNGGYDSVYYIKYRIPIRNYIFDTAIGFHSIWAQAPKRIEFICSIAVDHYRYWKDEGKEDETEDDKNTKLPKTEEGWYKYLRYNALDCYYTLLPSGYILHILNNMPWAMENFRVSMRQTLGPAMAFNVRGFNVNQKIQTNWEIENFKQAYQAEQLLYEMIGTTDFNPNSPTQYAKLLYDVLKVTPLKKRGKTKTTRSTNEKDLDLIRAQHWLPDMIIGQVLEVKKPKNNISKYGTYKLRTSGTGKDIWNGLELLNGRWMFKQNPVGTIFGRYNSTKSNLWVGQQVQNPPYEARAIVEPDPGFAVFRVDLSKADFWNTAFASGETRMMEIVMREAAGELDSHCFHASQFYSIEYDKIYAGYKNKEEWVVHSTKGCRQNTKRICYGANYLMAGYTLLLQMGIEAVRNTAIAMGHKVNNWAIKDYSVFCQSLINFYFNDLYPELMPWLQRRSQKVGANGYLETCAGGRTHLFFNNPLEDKATQRKLASFYGQGGTAGTINRALDKLYFEGYDNNDLMLLYQLHDEIGGQVRLDKMHLVKDVMNIMSEENEFEGRKFSIPTDAEIGLGWGYRMTDWHEGITIDELKEADAKWREKNPRLVA